VKYNLNKTRSGGKSPWTNRWSTLALLLIIFVFSAKGAWNSYSSKILSRDAADEKQEELQKLEARQAYLTEQLRKVETQEGREAVLREDFGLGRPDEQLAIIVEAKPEEGMNEGGNIMLNAVKNFFAELFKK
jgi:cell division protein FtsB